MKLLKMKSSVLCSIFGLQILLASNTVCAADGKSNITPLMTEEELRFLEAFADHDVDLNDNPPGISNDDNIRNSDTNDERDIREAVEKIVGKMKDGGIPDEDEEKLLEFIIDRFMDPDWGNPIDMDDDPDPGAGSRNDVDMDDEPFGGINDDPNPGADSRNDVDMDDEPFGGINDDPNPGADSRNDVDTNESDDSNKSKDDNNVKRAIRAEDMFVWSSEENTDSCSPVKEEIDRGLSEATTLDETAIKNLDLFYKHIPRVTPPLQMGDRTRLIATAQFWGTNWNGVRDIIIFHGRRDILRAVIGKYSLLWGNLTTERPPDSRLRLTCSDKNITTFTGKDGKKYWRFMDHRIDIEKPKQDLTATSPCDNRNTAVWPDSKLVLMCGSVWKNYPKTLESMIEEHKDYDNETHENYGIWKYLRLDDMMTLGGIMMHVLLHAFRIAGDVVINERYKVHQIYPENSKYNNVTAMSYYWCTALGRKDFRLKKELGERESIESAQSFVLYAKAVTLYLTEWFKRSNLPHFNGAGTLAKYKAKKKAAARVEG